MTRRAIFVSLCLLASVHCGDNPGGPSGQNLTGTWVGLFSDSGNTTGRLTWLLTHSGSQLTGTMSGNDTVSGVLTFSNATTTGSVTGSSLTSVWTFPLGSVVLLPNCAATINAQASVSNNTMTGTYSGTNTCTGPVTNGQFSLTKQ